MAITDQALSGKVALVTGGSRGIGRAIAIALGRRGATVVVNYASREDAARETAAAVEAAGGMATIAGFDVADSTAVTAAIKAIGTDHGRLDILVNNAGIAVNGLILRFTDEQWAKTMQINLTAAFHTVRAAASLVMRAKEGGRIINIASVVGEMGNAGQAAYAASKAGLIGFTRATAKELASRGVTCNAIAPGYIDTEMSRAEVPEAQRGKLLEQIPLGRVAGPEAIGDAAAFLAGPEAAYITGQVLRVNGGLLM